MKIPRYSAYLCTTLSTVVAMVASFLGSQHTFCFLQVKTILVFSHAGKYCGSDDNHEEEDEKDVDDDKNYPSLSSSGQRRTRLEKLVALMLTMAGGGARKDSILRF